MKRENDDGVRVSGVGLRFGFGVQGLEFRVRGFGVGAAVCIQGSGSRV